MTAEPVQKPRAARAFSLDEIETGPSQSRTVGEIEAPEITSKRGETVQPRTLTVGDLNRGIRWGSILISAAAALASLAATLWFTRFVSVALERNDWVGWAAFVLMSLIAVSACVLIARELAGFSKLARLARLRKSIKEAIAAREPAQEKAVALKLSEVYGGRSDMSWGLARLREHTGDVLAPGELLRLADREVLGPLDGEARRAILKTAKRVAMVTALSPLMWIAVGFVLVENIRLFRVIAGLYGGRPGFFGALRLARLVATHIIATGGVAMTDDLIGQFLGQDLLRRVSRRLGEGAFNGALTARLGVAAVEVTRPMPFLDTEPLRVREIFAELMRSLRANASERPAERAKPGKT